MVRLGNICKFQSGGTPNKSKPEYFNGNIPWITTVALNGGTINQSSTISWITELAIQESAAKIVPAHSIMVGTRVGIGKVAINSVPMSTSQDVISLVDIDDTKWDKHFICELILSKNQFLISQARGATIKGIKIETLSNIQIPDISLQAQRHIAAVLDKVSDLIAKRKQQLDKLDEMTKAKFVEMFGEPISNPHEWKQVALRELTTKIGSGATPRGGRESYQSEGITLIRSMNVYDGRFEYKDLAHITDQQAKQLENVTVMKGDVLINITGASVARSCVVPNNVLPARVNQHVAIVRCIPGKLDPIFTNNLFINDSFKRLLLNIGESGGATRQAITKQQLEALTIIVPPVELQQKFSSFAGQIGNIKLTVEESLCKMEETRKVLMQRYFG